MKKSVKTIIAVAALVALILLTVLTSYIAKLDENGNAIIGEQAEEEVSYLDAHWEDMMAEAAANAVSLETLFTEANGDLNTVAAKYATGTGNNFTITGRALVTDANTKSKAGYLVLKPEADTGDYTLMLQIGTIFKGSAMRDSLTCIKFSDFDNQMEWGDVNSQITARLYENLLKEYDMSEMIGRTVSFSGCFTLNSDSAIRITPFAFSAE